MIDFARFYQSLVNTPLQPWGISLPAVLKKKYILGHGLWPQWQQLLRELPLHHVDLVDFNAAAVSLISHTPLPSAEADTLRKILVQLKPWRKGPFQWFEISVDTEWRSD